ncbi:hypothetical protein Tco_0613447 [Tanacetum coccineum]
MKILIDELESPESNVLLPQLLDCDSTLPEESSESSKTATLLSSPFENEDKERNFLSISSDQEPLFHLELSVTETLLSFSFENEDKVFNPGIPISKGVHSFTLGLSHRTYETFKIVNVHPNNLNEEIPSDESKVHIEVLSVLWGNRLPILDGPLPLSRKLKDHKT